MDVSGEKVGCEYGSSVPVFATGKVQSLFNP